MAHESNSITRKPEKQRLRIFIRGAVQGVGFRPFIYRLAVSMQLHGWVSNSPQGVSIEAEGMPADLAMFLMRIQNEKPPVSFIQSMESSYLDPSGFIGFEIRESGTDGSKMAIVMPDIATCPDCVSEVFDPTNRRYRYPFTNCTNCGPRYSIIESLPYDRPNTSMKKFTMCPTCAAEYADPNNRRFHAQPNACPECGPVMEFWDPEGVCQAAGHDAISATSKMIHDGKIVAVKGLGGFHLIADAGNDAAIRLLRRRKHREEKPLALMIPSLETAFSLCEVSDLEVRLLTSPESPIVLLKTKGLHDPVSPLVAPDNPFLGCMLPYTPIHHLLMDELDMPVVATSGNLTDEPMCIDENEALTRLHGIADMFLVHERPIVRHVDDSIVRVMAGREMVIRRARGIAPLPIPFPKTSESILAVGAHLKGAITVTSGNQAFVSQHIGDLETPQAFQAFKDTIESIEGLYAVSPAVVACDKHPDYFSTRFARGAGIPRVEVQHHYSHILSCMAENELDAPVLGVAWDGTGLGDDGTIWGGEFLRINADGYTREAHFRTFPLPGGSAAVREPRRSALGVLYEDLGDVAFHMDEFDFLGTFEKSELTVLKKMLANGVNCPMTSSVGRLFDAVASIIGLKQYTGFEGQAAMALEFAIGALKTDERYHCELATAAGRPSKIDWRNAVSDIIEDVQSGVCRALIAARFHNMLAETIVEVAEKASEPAIVLSGGCFQNKYLLERSVQRLREAGFRPYWHQRIPSNDGGIALGQAVAASIALNGDSLKTVKTERRATACA